MQQPGNMKTELQAILGRLRRDAKNYRLAAAAFLVYAVVVTLLFGRHDGDALSGLWKYQSAVSRADGAVCRSVPL